MFRPPFIARVAAGAAVYVLEETRRLPAAAIHLPITTISQLLQVSMHAQQFVTSLALKGDAVFERLSSRPVEQPEWATFDEDVAPDQVEPTADTPNARVSAFDRFTPEPAAETVSEIAPRAETAPHEPSPQAEPAPQDETAAEPEPLRIPDPTHTPDGPEPEYNTESSATAKASTNGRAPGEVLEPPVAARYDYLNLTLAQLRARLRMLTLDDLAVLLDYERKTRDRAPFVTMLTNRIATVRAQ
jgi:hypothetical protein